MYRLETVKKTHFFLTCFLLIFIVIGVLLSFSRGAWFNLAISTLIYFVLRFSTACSKQDFSGLIKVGGVIMIAFFGVFFWAISSTDISEVFFRRASLTQEYDIEAGGRFDSIQIVIQKIMQSPMGIGPGESIHRFELDPHNLYIHIIAETGWLGGIAFCSFLLVTLWKGFLFTLTDSKLQGAFIVVFACVVGTLLESMIIHSTHWRHLYLLLAMLWGVMIAGRKLILKPKIIS